MDQSTNFLVRSERLIKRDWSTKCFGRSERLKRRDRSKNYLERSDRLRSETGRPIASTEASCQEENRGQSIAKRESKKGGWSINFVERSERLRRRDRSTHSLERSERLSNETVPPIASTEARD